MKRELRILAEFESGRRALVAADAFLARGSKLLEAYTPYAMPELEQRLGLKRPRLLLGLVLAAAIIGALGSYTLMWWTAAVSYPLNVGGRPLNSFVTDIPIMFESSVLLAALTAFSCVLVFSGMPRLDHPLETITGFERTTIDRFWLALSVPEEGLPLETLLISLGGRLVCSLKEQP